MISYFWLALNLIAMKQALLLVFVMTFSLWAQAASTGEFSYNKNAVSTEMQELDALESYVNANGNVTLQEMKQTGNPLAMNISESNTPFSNYGDMPLGIPAFWWGFVLGCIGILLVYLILEDRDETMMSVWGCIAGAVFWSLLSLLTGIGNAYLGF
jgi:hypothetical protein